MTREQAINYLFSCGFTNEQAGDVVRALTYEPTTKNDLGVDREQLKTMIRGLTKWYVKRDNTEVGEPNTAVGLLYDDVMFGIDRLHPVTPQEPQSFKWCDTCKEYDQEKHCCHRYSKVIRDTVAEIEQEPRWIPVSEKLPEDLEPVNITWVNHEPEPYYHDIKDKNFVATGIHYRGQWYWYSTTCADYLGEYGSNDIDKVDDAVEIVAWMPLPKPYEPQESEG